MAYDPLIPVFYDIAWSGLVVVALLTLVVSLVQIGRAPSLSSTARAIWVLVVLFVPIAGPVVWFFVGRRPLPAKPQYRSAPAERAVVLADLFA
jgi:hypothetical protein